MTDKLGIGLNSDLGAPKITANITKVSISETIKIKALTRFSSSSNVHIAQTNSEHLIWGLNENGRINHLYYTDLPKLTTPLRFSRGFSFCRGKGETPNLMKAIIPFDNLVVEFVKQPLSQLWVSGICGYPRDLSPFFETKFIKIPFLPIQRSNHFKMFLFDYNIDSSKLPLQIPSILSAGSYSPQDAMKTLNYLSHTALLERDMLFYANPTYRENVIPEVLGVPQKDQFFDRVSGLYFNYEVYRKMPLKFEIDGKKVGYFSNIINGPKTTILITKDKKLYGYGSNQNNLLGIADKEMTLVFPPKLLEFWPKFEEIKQISIGEQHSLVLLKNSTVLGIGSNLNCELGRNDTNVFKSFIQIQFSEYEENCIQARTCSIELVAAEKEASFFVFNYGPESHVYLEPVCFGKSHLDLDTCSSNGMCMDEDTCKCFGGYSGKKCEIVLDCSNLKNCSGNGYCNTEGNCTCAAHATGNDCSIPVFNPFFF